MHIILLKIPDLKKIPYHMFHHWPPMWVILRTSGNQGFNIARADIIWNTGQKFTYVFKNRPPAC